MSKRLQSGKELLEKGQFEKAIQELTIHISSNGNDVEALFLRGVASRKQTKLDASLLDFNRAIKLAPQKAELYCERGILYHMMSLGTKAIEDMNFAVSLEPTNPFRYASRAYIKETTKDTKGAIADYQRAIELDPDDEISLNNIGLLQEKLGRMKEAKRNFKKSDDLLKSKGKYLVNEDTENIEKDELEVTTTPDGKVGFKSGKKQKEQAAKTVPVEEKKLGVKEYVSTVRTVFSSKDELKSFLNFVKQLFKKK